MRFWQKKATHFSLKCLSCLNLHLLHKWCNDRHRRSFCFFTTSPALRVKVKSRTWMLVRCKYMTQATWKHTHSTSSSNTIIPLRNQRAQKDEKSFAAGSISPIGRHTRVRTVESSANRWSQRAQPGSETAPLHWWSGRRPPGYTGGKKADHW